MPFKIKRNKIFTPILLFIILLALLGVAAYQILNYTVSDIIMQSIDELAEHDMRSIREYISEQWDAMRSICSELQNENPDDIKDVQDKLNVKVLAGRFDRVYFITDDGQLYSDNYIVYGKSENEFLSYFTNNTEQFVFRYDDKGRFHELKREYLLYGLDLSKNPLRLAGTDFVGMIALNDISKIQSQIRITSFNGKGYSSVINPNGYYIVNIDRTSSLDQLPNFYELLENGQIVSGQTAEGIKEKIKNRESFEFTYINDKGTKKYVLIKPIEDSIWLFVNSVETSVFAAETFNFMAITMGVIIAMLLIMLIVFCVYYFTSKKLKKIYASIIDGLYNRQYYDEKLSKESVKAFAMLDLDHLKHINDNYGHLAGDQAIEKIAEILLLNIGPIGDVVRYGGDEFAIAFKSEVTEEDFLMRLENILYDVRQVRLEKFPEINLSLSIGGYYCEGVTAELFKPADNLLYEAKKTRNRVITNIEPNEPMIN